MEILFKLVGSKEVADINNTSRFLVPMGGGPLLVGQRWTGRGTSACHAANGPGNYQITAQFLHNKCECTPTFLSD